MVPKPISCGDVALSEAGAGLISTWSRASIWLDSAQPFSPPRTCNLGLVLCLPCSCAIDLHAVPA
jgi:hypothetical protein